MTRPVRTIISTGLIAIVALCAIVGFNALASHLSQPNGQSGQPGGTTSSTTSEQGVLLGGAPAPNFSLIDQSGATVTLASLKGRPTVLTFFDSLCPHTDCSLMAQYINFTARDAGASASAVNWVAISLNPWHDTPQSVDTFLKNQNMKPDLRYLLGTQEQLQPVWDAFHMQSILQQNGVVIHTTGVYLLDAQTNEQLFMDEGFDPATLGKDITSLLQNGPSAFKGQSGAQSANATTLTHSAGAMQVTLTATPGAYGSYNFTVLLQDGSGVAVPNATVAMDLTMPSMPAMSPVHVTLKAVQPVTTGAYRADGVLSMTGQWDASITIRPQSSTTPAITSFIFSAAY
jgi:protein SCO1/2